MPLYDEGPSRIRMNLQALQEGKKPCVVAIGTLTESQLTAINASRASQGYPPIQAEILFLGRHVYKSRVLGDGYTIEDVIDQIASALHRESVALEAPKMTTMENPVPRNDRYGNAVRDRAVLECSARHPKAELFSVIPKGDHNRPKKKPLISDERLETQRLARVTTAPAAPVAAKDSMLPKREPSQ
jgi:hypothetical protein